MSRRRGRTETEPSAMALEQFPADIQGQIASSMGAADLSRFAASSRATRQFAQRARYGRRWCCWTPPSSDEVMAYVRDRVVEPMIADIRAAKRMYKETGRLPDDRDTAARTTHWFGISSADRTTCQFVSLSIIPNYQDADLGDDDDDEDPADYWGITIQVLVDSPNQIDASGGDYSNDIGEPYDAETIMQVFATNMREAFNDTRAVALQTGVLTANGAPEASAYTYDPRANPPLTPYAFTVDDASEDASPPANVRHTVWFQTELYRYVLEQRARRAVPCVDALTRTNGIRDCVLQYDAAKISALMASALGGRPYDVRLGEARTSLRNMIATATQ